MVDAAKEHILAGDAFQIVPSQRFSLPFKLPPLSLYRSLRRINPSPSGNDWMPCWGNATSWSVI